MSLKESIGWCDMTWNPVWGCHTGCEYCYARQMAKRFAKRIAEKNFKGKEYEACRIAYEASLKQFIPTWVESSFSKKFPKKPSLIFVNSMSDIR